MPYNREWYKANKERIAERQREYYKENKEQMLKKNKEYRRETKEARSLQSKRYYQENKTHRLEFCSQRRKNQKILVDAIAVHYGCCNPNCKWSGPYKACHLDFHHLDPTAKERAVSTMCAYNKKRIAAEINKCVVLCRNCHCEFHLGEMELGETMLCHVDDELNIIS